MLDQNKWRNIIKEKNKNIQHQHRADGHLHYQCLSNYRLLLFFAAAAIATNNNNNNKFF